MEFRIAHESDRRQVEGLWGYCFEPPEHPFFQWYFSRFWQPGNTLCGFEQTRLAACVHLNPYTLRLRESVVPVSYIVGLATAPEARRGGVAGKLLLAALTEMRGREQYFNILMPSKAGFYYPFGWELCYHHVKYQIDLEELRRLTGREGTFEMVTSPNKWSKLAIIYNHFTANRHGCALRGETEWRRLIESHQAENGHIALLLQEKRPTGYLFYHVRDGVVMAGDMAYTDWQAQRTLLGFLYNHRSPASSAEWNAPLDDSLHLTLPNPKKGVSLFPFMAGRIVEVAGALQSVRYPAERQGRLIISVSDSLAQWNNGNFAVTVTDGQSQVEIVQADSPDISCDIGALSLLVFGRLSAEELRYSGRLAASSTENLDLLSQWFPKQNNYINEYF